MAYVRSTTGKRTTYVSRTERSAQEQKELQSQQESLSKATTLEEYENKYKQIPTRYKSKFKSPESIKNEFKSQEQKELQDTIDKVNKEIQKKEDRIQMFSSQGKDSEARQETYELRAWKEALEYARQGYSWESVRGYAAQKGYQTIRQEQASRSQKQQGYYEDLLSSRGIFIAYAPVDKSGNLDMSRAISSTKPIKGYEQVLINARTGDKINQATMEKLKQEGIISYTTETIYPEQSSRTYVKTDFFGNPIKGTEISVAPGKSAPKGYNLLATNKDKFFTLISYPKELSIKEQQEYLKKYPEKGFWEEPLLTPEEQNKVYGPMSIRFIKYPGETSKEVITRLKKWNKSTGEYGTYIVDYVDEEGRLTGESILMKGNEKTKTSRLIENVARPIKKTYSEFDRTFMVPMIATEQESIVPRLEKLYPEKARRATADFLSPFLLYGISAPTSLIGESLTDSLLPSKKERRKQALESMSNMLYGGLGEYVHHPIKELALFGLTAGLGGGSLLFKETKIANWLLPTTKLGSIAKKSSNVLGFGLTGLYGTSVYERVKKQPTRKLKEETFGAITFGEIIPSITGFTSFSKVEKQAKPVLTEGFESNLKKVKTISIDEEPTVILEDFLVSSKGRTGRTIPIVQERELQFSLLGNKLETKALKPKVGFIDTLTRGTIELPKKRWENEWLKDISIDLGLGSSKVTKLGKADILTYDLIPRVKTKARQELLNFDFDFGQGLIKARTKIKPIRKIPKPLKNKFDENFLFLDLGQNQVYESIGYSESVGGITKVKRSLTGEMSIIKPAEKFKVKLTTEKIRGGKPVGKIEKSNIILTKAKKQPGLFETGMTDDIITGLTKDLGLPTVKGKTKNVRELYLVEDLTSRVKTKNIKNSVFPRIRKEIISKRKPKYEEFNTLINIGRPEKFKPKGPSVKFWEAPKKKIINKEPPAVYQSLFRASEISPSETLKKTGKVYGFSNIQDAEYWITSRKNPKLKIWQFMAKNPNFDTKRYSRSAFTDNEWISKNVISESLISSKPIKRLPKQKVYKTKPGINRDFLEQLYETSTTPKYEEEFMQIITPLFGQQIEKRVTHIASNVPIRREYPNFSLLPAAMNLNRHKLTPKLQPKLSPKLQPKMADRLIPRLTPKLQPKLSPKLQPKLSTRLTPKLTTRLTSRLATRLVSRNVTRLIPKIPSINPPTIIGPLFGTFKSKSRKYKSKGNKRKRKYQLEPTAFQLTEGIKLTRRKPLYQITGFESIR